MDEDELEDLDELEEPETEEPDPEELEEPGKLPEEPEEPAEPEEPELKKFEPELGVADEGEEDEKGPDEPPPFELPLPPAAAVAARVKCIVLWRSMVNVLWEEVEMKNDE